MKKKSYLIEIGNDGFKHWYTFERNEGFKEILTNLLLSLKFKKDYVDTVFVSENQHTDEITEKISDIVVEHVRFYSNDKFNIEVFYGTKSIILIVRTKFRKLLVKVAEKLFKTYPEFEK